MPSLDNDIHPTAVVSRGARLGRDNVIGPFVVISAAVTLGDGNWIGAHSNLGAPPEIRGFDHGGNARDERAEFGLIIGSDNVLRESVNITSGSHKDTSVGHGTFIMNQAYVAHDCVIGDDVTIASSVTLAGHCTVGRGANLGLGVAAHQFTTIGAYAMVGMSSVVTREVPPFAVAFGAPAMVRKVNRVGMERNGFSPADIAWVTEWTEKGFGDVESAPERVRRYLG